MTGVAGPVDGRSDPEQRLQAQLDRTRQAAGLRLVSHHLAADQLRRLVAALTTWRVLADRPPTNQPPAAVAFSWLADTKRLRTELEAAQALNAGLQGRLEEADAADLQIERQELSALRAELGRLKAHPDRPARERELERQLFEARSELNELRFRCGRLEAELRQLKGSQGEPAGDGETPGEWEPAPAVDGSDGAEGGYDIVQMAEREFGLAVPRASEPPEEADPSSKSPSQLDGFLCAAADEFGVSIAPSQDRSSGQADLSPNSPSQLDAHLQAAADEFGVSMALSPHSPNRSTSPLSSYSPNRADLASPSSCYSIESDDVSFFDDPLSPNRSVSPKPASISPLDLGRMKTPTSPKLYPDEPAIATAIANLSPRIRAKSECSDEMEIMDAEQLIAQYGLSPSEPRGMQSPELQGTKDMDADQLIAQYGFALDEPSTSPRPKTPEIRTLETSIEATI